MERARPRAKAAGREREGLDAAQVKALGAPFALRCGALLIDYTIVAGIVAGATIFSRMFGGSNTQVNATINAGYLIALAGAALNFIVLPLLAGQTAGKWATGLRVVRRDGKPAGIVNVLLRHTVGYLLSLVTLGVGFVVAAFSAEGRALHDYLAGTVVVRRPGRAPARVR